MRRMQEKLTEREETKQRNDKEITAGIGQTGLQDIFNWKETTKDTKACTILKNIVENRIKSETCSTKQ